MEVLFFLLGGLIAGFIYSLFNDLFNRTYGVITVDHERNLCRVKIANEDLNDRKVKKAVFKVYHTDKTLQETDIDFSREEQRL